jgi:hypothetical protein
MKLLIMQFYPSKNEAILEKTILWDMTPCSPLKPIDVSEELTASIFRIKE